MADRSFEVKTSDGTMLSGKRIGDPSKPVLVFSHSLGCTAAMWTDQAEALSDRFCVLLYDTRGHGQSGAPPGAYSLCRLSLDVLEILDALEIEQAHFCGLSLGGMIGQVLAVRAPQRLASLVLAATSAYLGPPSGWQARIDLVSAEGMAALEEVALPKWFAPQGFAAETRVEAARGWLLNTDPIGYTGCCAAIRDMDLRALAAGNHVETLVLAGAHDTATPREHSAFLSSRASHAALVELQGAHLLNLEQPAAFTAALEDFYLQLDAA